MRKDQLVFNFETGEFETIEDIKAKEKAAKEAEKKAKKQLELARSNLKNQVKDAIKYLAKEAKAKILNNAYEAIFKELI